LGRASRVGTDSLSMDRDVIVMYELDEENRRPVAAAVVVVAAMLGGVALLIIFAWVLSMPETCEGVDLEGLSEQQASELLAAGWEGVAGDGAERLYPPNCLEQVRNEVYRGLA
jgi:hypothetical protein